MKKNRKTGRKRTRDFIKSNSSIHWFSG